MPNTKNISVLEDLKERASRSKSILVAQYTGLNSKQQVELRSELKKVGAEMLVAKNTLVDRIVNNEKVSPHLAGQTGVIFSYEDEVSALKTVVAFIKTADVLKLKVGIVAGNVYEEKSLVELSKLPSKLELIAQLLNRVNTPATKLVGVLTASQRNLVYALDAIAKKKQA